MLKRFKLLSLAAFVIAAALSSCQKQEMESFSNEAVSSDGTRASSFSSKYGIDWGKVTKKYSSSSYPAFYSMQATADKDNVYLLLRAKPGEMKKGHAYDNELSVFVYDKSNGSTRYWNDQKSTRVDAMGGWLMKDSNPKFTSWNDKVSSQAVTYDDYYYYEIRYPRSISSLLKGSSIKIGVRMENNYKRSNGTYASSSDVKVIGILPSKGSDMYSVSSSSSNGNNTSTSNHCSDIGKTPMVMAYVPAYSSCPSSSEAEERLTHINYFGYKTDANGNLSNKYDDVTISDVLKLKKSKSSLKVLLTVGGASKSGTKAFSSMANSETARKNFCNQCKNLVTAKYSIDGKEYTLDGVDLDWEHPDGSTDRKNFNQLLQDLRETLGNKKIISAAVSSNPSHYDWSGAMKYLDYVNVMTYDINWPSDGAQYTSHHSALYKSSSSKNPASKCVSAAAKAYKDAGVPINKQNLGVAFYGHGTNNYDPDKHDGVAFHNISSTVIENSKWDDAAMVPYYYKSSSDYLGYENEKSVNLKGQYAKLNGFLGVMIWEYGHDNGGKLLKALSRGMKGEDRYGDPSSKTKSDLPLYK